MQQVCHRGGQTARLWTSNNKYPFFNASKAAKVSTVRMWLAAKKAPHRCLVAMALVALAPITATPYDAGILSSRAGPTATQSGRSDLLPH